MFLSAFLLQQRQNIDMHADQLLFDQVLQTVLLLRVAKLGLIVGDPSEADHKNPFSKVQM